MSADAITLGILRSQTERRHPEWFDVTRHLKPMERELRMANEQKDKVERMLDLAKHELRKRGLHQEDIDRMLRAK